MNRKQLESNYEMLKGNVYPGRGIILGMSPDSKNMVQVYWIMGRSQNSRNRVFEEENGFVRTKAFDESKLVDPSLIIYYPARHCDNCHIITNGDQTDTIYNELIKGGSFEKALDTRCFEPDAPNFTPRISGITYTGNSQYTYKLSILKSYNNDGATSIRQYFDYEKGIAGVGHCIHTYEGDGNPLPSFSGEPYELELFDDIDKTTEFYWDALNDDNKVSLLVKYISVDDGSFKIKIINKNQ